MQKYQSILAKDGPLLKFMSKFTQFFEHQNYSNFLSKDLLYPKVSKFE